MTSLRNTLPPCYLLPLRTKYPPQHPTLEHPQPDTSSFMTPTNAAFMCTSTVLHVPVSLRLLQGALHQDLNFKRTVNKAAANSHRIELRHKPVTAAPLTDPHCNTKQYTHESAITLFHLQHNSSASKLTSCLYEQSNRPAAITNSPRHALYTYIVILLLYLLTVCTVAVWNIYCLSLEILGIGILNNYL